MKSRLRVAGSVGLFLALLVILAATQATAQETTGNPALDSATELLPVDGTTVLLHGEAAPAADGEPAPSCLNTDAESSKWFSWEPQVDGTARLFADEAGRFVSIYEGAPGSSFDDLVPVACGRLFGSSTFGFSSQTTYFVQVRQQPGPVTGRILIDIAPANDDIVDAEIVEPTDGSPAQLIGSSPGSSLEPGETTPSCGVGRPSIWYRYTPSFSGDIVIDPRTSSATIGVYTAASADPSVEELTEIECGLGVDDIVVTVDEGTTYWISGSSPVGAFGATIEEASPPPANDNLVAATELDFVGDSLYGEGSVYRATRESDEPSLECGPGSTVDETIWFRWTSDFTGTVAIGAIGSGSVAKVYTSSATDPTFGDLSEVGCDGRFRDAASEVEAGETYWVQAGGNESAAFRVSRIQRPANDNLIDAEEIATTDGKPVVVLHDSTDASRESGEPGTCVSASNTVWFKWQPDFSGSTEFSGPGVRVGVFLGGDDSPPDFGSIGNLVACGRGGSFNAIEGGTYWMQVSASRAAYLTLRPLIELDGENDDITDAWPIVPTDGSPAPFFAFVNSMTTQTAEPTASCFDELTPTRWYTWTPEFTGEAKLDAVDVAVYSAASGTPTFDDLSEVACGDSLFPVAAGTTYWVQATGSLAVGFNATLSEASSPANDDLSDAEALPSVDSTFSFDFDGLDATLEADETEPSCYVFARPSVWYRWTAPASMAVEVDLPSSQTATVYTSAVGEPVHSDLSEVGCGRDLFDLDVEAGTTYWISVRSGSVGQVVVRPIARPSNDDLVDAAPIFEVSGGASYIDAETGQASIEGGEGDLSCGPAFDAAPSFGSVWFSWTPEFDGVASLTRGVSYFDVFTADSDEPSHDDLTEVVCGSGDVTWDVDSGQTYWIRAAGSVDQALLLTPTLAPLNDDLADAAVEEVVDGAPFEIAGNTEGATIEPDEIAPVCAADAEAPSVWYRWTPAFGEVVSFSATRSGTAVAVYTAGVATPSPADLVALGCSQSDGQPGRFIASAGRTFWFQLTGQSQDVAALVESTPLLDDWGADEAPSLPVEVFGFTGSLEDDESEPTCPVGDASSAWFTWTADTSGEVILDPTGSSPGVVVTLYTGDGRSDGVSLAQGLTEVVCIEAPIDRVIKVEAGTRYWVQAIAPSNPSDIAIDIRPLSAEGDRQFVGQFGPIELPTNGGELAFDASGASFELDEDSTVCGPAHGNSVWLSWTPTSSVSFEVLANGALEVSIDGASPICAPPMIDASTGDTFLFRFDAPAPSAAASRITLTPYCDDEDPITADTFDPDTGECQNVPIEGAACNDDDASTENDVIVDGECVGEPIDCDDGDPYTIDVADPQRGCVYIQGDRPPEIVAPADLTIRWEDSREGTDLGVPTVSDDSGEEPTVSNDAPDVFPLGETLVTWTATDSAGNVSLAVQSVRVLPPEPGFCNDGDPLTVDSFDADAGACVTEPVPDGTACSDDDLSTENDVVVDGECVGEPIDCDDGDPLTVDSADPELGCVHTDPEPATISGTVWHDSDYNDVRDPGEGPRQGVQVTLFATGADGAIASTFTDGNGAYLFTDLDPSTFYSVHFEAPGAWYFVEPDVGEPTRGPDVTTDSDATPSGRVPRRAGAGLYARPGVDYVIDAGVRRSMTVQATIFYDEDGDGRKDSLEGPMPEDEITVELLDGDGTKVDCIGGNPSVAGICFDDQLRDAPNGVYSFTVLEPGEFGVRVVTLDGRVITTPLQVDPATGLSPVFELGADRLGLFLTVGISVPEFEMELLTPDVQVAELASAFVPIRMTPSFGGDVQFVVDVGDETQLVVEPRAGTLPHWQTTNSQFILRVSGIDEDIADGDVAVPITVTFTGGGYTGQSVTVTATVLDDDVASVVVEPISGLETSESGGRASFQVVLGVAPTLDVTIPISVSDPTEGEVNVDFVEFNRLNWDVPQKLQVNGVDDELDDGDVEFVVQLGAIVGPGAWNGLDPDDVTVTNRDDDESTVSGVLWYDTDEDGIRDPGEPSYPNALLQLVDDGGNTVDSLVSTDGTYEFVAPGPGTYRVVVELLQQYLVPWSEDPTTVDAGGDDTVDSDFEPIVFGDARSAPFDLGPGLIVEHLDIGVVRKIAGSVTVNPTSGLITDESGTTDSFTVVLDSQPLDDVTIPLAVSDAAEALLDQTSLVFTPDDWNQPQTVVVTGRQDGFQDGDKPFTIIVGVAQGGGYAGIDPDDVSVTNLDDDEPVTTGTVSGVYWLDENYNGLRDVGEERLANRLVRLYPEDSTLPMGQMYTGDDGTYSFDNVPAGTYLVRFAVSTDQRLAPADVGTDDTIDSDAGFGFNGEFTEVFEVVAGQDAALDVGSSYRITVSGRVWLDEGADGVQEFGSGTYAPGAFVELLDGAGNVLDSQNNTGDGRFVFDGLLPGDYGVRITPPVGSELTSGPDVDVSGSGLSPIESLTAAPGNRLAVFNAGVVYPPPADTTDPDITAPDDVNVLQGQPVVLGSPTVSDDTDPSPVVTNDAPVSFPLGATTVTWTATDAAGNSASDTQVVIVSAPSVKVTPTSGLQTSEGGATDSFTVVLGATPTGPVTIAVSSSDAGEGTADLAELQFGVGDWDQPKTVTVTGVDDAIDDGNVGYTIVLGAASGGGYEGVDPVDVSVTNVDDDEPATTGTVSGIYWLDADYDGLRDPGESGLSNRQVQLFEQGSATPVDVVNTDANGAYEFGAVPAGTYRVEFALQTDQRFAPGDVGNDDSVDSDVVDGAFTAYFPVTAGQESAVDAGASYRIRVIGRVWNDAGADGVEEFGGLIGVGGVTVELRDGAGAVLDTTLTTGGSGGYSFEGLVPGQYQVRVVLPQGRIFTSGPDVSVDPNTGLSPIVSLSAAAGERELEVKAGLAFAPKTITVSPTSGLVTTEAGGSASFTVVLDVAPSGPVTIPVSSSDVGEGTTSVGQVEFGVGDWDQPKTVTVTGVDDAADDGDASYTVVLGVASGGGYGGVDPADVSVTNIDDDDPVDTTPPVISAPADVAVAQGEPVVLGSPTVSDDTDPSPVVTNDAPVSFPVGVTTVTWTATDAAGNSASDTQTVTVTAATGTVSGTYWLDEDYDGLRDGGESGLGSRRVRLYPQGSTSPIGDVYTAGDGSYSFSDVPAGTYQVRFSVSTDQRFAPGDVGTDDTIDSDAGFGFNGEFTDFFTVSGGQEVVKDVASSYRIFVSGRVWNDAGADGVQEFDGPSRASGVLVELRDGAGNVLDTRLTSATGNYTFDELLPGQYQIRVVLPDGKTFTSGPDVAINPATGLSVIESLSGAAGNREFRNVNAGLA